jgi:F-type H+-transporting ATPase subunit a
MIFGLFVFIWIANLSGLLPGVGTIGSYHEKTETAEVAHVEDGEHEEEEGTTVAATDDHAEEGHHKVLVPFIRPPNADLNMTLAMALIAVGSVQILGIRAHGFGGRIKHMADPPFLFPIEVIGEVSRVVSLGARLFGNVFAGEVLLGVMFALGAALKIALLPVLFPVVFLFLEVMFGTIQALVFSLLTVIYITLAAAHGHGDDHDEEHHKEAHHPAATPAVGD